MSYTSRSFVTCAGIALAVMIAMHAAGTSTAIPTSGPGAIEARALEPTEEVGREARCGRCGDGACVKSCGETPTSCPQDCGVPSEALCGRCGDGACVKSCGETPASCPRDCAGGPAESLCGKCGDGFCNPRCGETATSCPADCGAST